MKQFNPYRNIRIKAMIMGLPLSFFAVQMTAVIGSLLVVIFSFSLSMIVGVVAFNVKLFAGLNLFTKYPKLLHFKKVFPEAIRMKKNSGLRYEEY